VFKDLRNLDKLI